MGKYKIADINIFMSNSGERTEKQAEKYLYDYKEDTELDMSLKNNEILESYELYLKKHKYTKEQLTLDDYLYGLYGTKFAIQVLEHNGYILHSSAVAVDGNAYLFSANSGVGKSTHTSLWLDYFKDRALIINDDKPCIREVQGELYVYGTPWSGKNDSSTNGRFKLKAITFICRSQENWIKQISKAEAISLFLTQSYRVLDKKHMDLLLSMINLILSKIKVYKMGCNISEDAVKLAYETMSFE